AIAGRAPCASSCGSTSSRRPSSSTRSVACRMRVIRIRAQRTPRHGRRSRPVAFSGATRVVSGQAVQRPTAGSIDGVKVSISLPDDDVEFIDQYAATAGRKSRSAVVHQAIGLLRNMSLESAYTAAWNEWESSEDARLWDRTVDDGIADAPW